MKNKRPLRWLSLLGILALFVLCIAAAFAVYLQARARAFNSRPLVLILSPVNHEQAQVGDGITVRATARAARGVSRMELWADDVFVASQENPAGQAVSPLVFSAAWTPASTGIHALLVRAVSEDGVDGQAAIVIEVVGEGEGAAPGGDTAQQGVGPGGGEAGDQPTAPGGDETSEEPPADEDVESGPEMPGDESAPVPDDRAPGEFLEVVGFVLPDDLIPAPGTSDEPVSLRVEALSLQSDEVYESLHCYIGVADGLPRWYPDADGDQSTDESFSTLGEEMWNVGEFLSGEAAPIITVPGNQPLSIDATCVGISGGGTEAVELGQLLLQIPPSEWDGVSRWSPEVSSEGSFQLEYRVGAADETGHGEPVWLDPSMTPPTNLRLAGFWAAGHSLYWSYEPRPDEEPIGGFRVYLNGTLLWVEPPESRTTALPSQWLFPCAEPYTFTVTAFREGYPDGPESTPSTPPVVIEAEPEHCDRVVYVSFLNLTTHDLGGDGHHEDRSGDVGAAYGYFYANDQQVSFDGRGGNFSGLGLSHNSRYGVRDLLDWSDGGLSQFRVELAENELLQVGFHIDDEDTGRCHAASDPGCDELICEGEAMLDVDVRTTSDERTILSRDGRCEVTYALGLGAGFPAEGYGGEAPLPWLTVEEVTMTEGSQIRIHIKNSGRTSWPSREVKAAITRRTGEIVNVLSWPAISLAPGETSILQTATMDFGDLPVCAILDPDNEVEEWGDQLESAGIMQAHAPVCMKLPDLIITGLEYDPGASHLLVTVQNQGEGVLENRAIALNHGPLGGGPAAAPPVPSLISLAPWESAVLNMPAPESIHSQWSEGYVVRVDPNDLIAESDNDNNSYAVPGGGRLRLAWTHIMAPYEARNRVNFDMSVYVVSAGSRRQVASWQINQNIDWNSWCVHDVTHGECSSVFQQETPYDTDWFDIAGDEALEINVSVGHERPVRDDFGHTFTWLAAGETYGAADGWGAGDPDAVRSCTMIDMGPGEHGWVLGNYLEWVPSLGYWQEYHWYVNFNLCRENPGH